MITIRKATKDDARLLWKWANEKKVRENAYRQEEIPWSTHIEWLKNKLSTDTSFIFIAKDGDTFIGQIRFDLKEKGNAVVDVSVDRSMRGKGYGTAIIEYGTDHFLELQPETHVHAYVKKSNAASKKAFEKAGYRLKDVENIKGSESYHLVKQSSL